MVYVYEWPMLSIKTKCTKMKCYELDDAAEAFRKYMWSVIQTYNQMLQSSQLVSSVYSVFQFWTLCVCPRRKNVTMEEGEKRESRSGWVNDHFQSWNIFPIAKGNKNKGWKMLSVWHRESRKRVAFSSSLQTGSLKITHLSHIGFQWSLQYRCMCNYSPCPHTHLRLHTAWTRTH